MCSLGYDGIYLFFICLIHGGILILQMERSVSHVIWNMLCFGNKDIDMVSKTRDKFIEVARQLFARKGPPVPCGFSDLEARPKSGPSFSICNIDNCITEFRVL